MKYDKLIDLEYEESPLVEGEQLIWNGKPKKGYFILSNVAVAGLIPFILIWTIFDGFMIGALLFNMTKELRVMMPLYGFFFTIHLMPVWMWLSEIISSNRNWKRTEYYITDKRIIVKNGLYSGKYESIYYKDVIDAKVQIGSIDKAFGVGDIYIKTTYGTVAFMDIRNVTEVSDKLLKVIKEKQKNMGIENIYNKKKKQ